MKEEKVFRMNWFSFFIAFALGIFYVYISSPKPRLIIKYPTPYNANKVLYQNDEDICYKYNVEEVKCSSDAITQPIA
jgi:hypothetical protein